MANDLTPACTVGDFLTTTGLSRSEFDRLVLATLDEVARLELPPLGVTLEAADAEMLAHFQCQWLLLAGRSKKIGSRDAAARWDRHVDALGIEEIRRFSRGRWGRGGTSHKPADIAGPQGQEMSPLVPIRIRQLEQERAVDAQALIDLAAAVLTLEARVRELEARHREYRVHDLALEVKERGNQAIRKAFGEASALLREAGVRKGEVSYPGGKERFTYKASTMRKRSQSTSTSADGTYSGKGGVDLTTEITGLAAKVAGLKGGAKLNMDLLMDRKRAVADSTSDEDHLSVEGSIDVDLGELKIVIENH